MKKILLLLSCFLATWCGVQAATAVTSATYNSNNSTITAYYTISNASSAKLGLMSTRIGNSYTNPLNPKSVSTNSTSATLNVNQAWEECDFVVLIYTNGNNNPSGATSVKVTAKGSINYFNISGTSVTANYTMWHGNNSNSTIKVFKKSNNALVNTIKLSNPNTTKNVSLGTYEYDTEYICVLYTNGRELNRKNFKITPPVVKGEIKLATYKPQYKTITVEYNLGNAEDPWVIISDGNGNKITSVKITNTNSSSTKTVTINNVEFAGTGYYAQISAKNYKGSPWVSNKMFISTVGGEGDGTTYADNKITNLWYDRSTNKINVDFQLKTSGVNVQLKAMDTRQGGTWDQWISGRTWYCPQSSGSDFITVPSYNGTVMYVVFLYVNGNIAASKQIMISR